MAKLLKILSKKLFEKLLENLGVLTVAVIFHHLQKERNKNHHAALGLAQEKLQKEIVQSEQLRQVASSYAKRNDELKAELDKLKAELEELNDKKVKEEKKLKAALKKLKVENKKHVKHVHFANQFLAKMKANSAMRRNQNQSQSRSRNRNQSQSRNRNQEKQNQNEQRVCRHWIQKRNCRFGDTCKFVHPDPSARAPQKPSAYVLPAHVPIASSSGLSEENHAWTANNSSRSPLWGAEWAFSEPANNSSGLSGANNAWTYDNSSGLSTWEASERPFNGTADNSLGISLMNVNVSHSDDGSGNSDDGSDDGKNGKNSDDGSGNSDGSGN